MTSRTDPGRSHTRRRGSAEPLGVASPTPAAASAAARRGADSEMALRVRVVKPGIRDRGGLGRFRLRRLRALLRFVLFLFLVFLAVWAGVRVAQAAAGSGAHEPETHVVKAGETLWDIASRHYGNDVDPRRGVFTMRRANALSARDVLQPGDLLVLPSIEERVDQSGL